MKVELGDGSCFGTLLEEERNRRSFNIQNSEAQITSSQSILPLEATRFLLARECPFIKSL